MRWFLFVLMIASATCSMAQEAGRPPQPSEAQAKQLIEDGDRLADQGDYGGALEKYTEAYHAFVSRIRGQKFKHQVLPTLLTRAELGKEMLHIMDREYTAEEWHLMDSSYKVLGLMPRDMQSKELMARLLTEEVAGFYDPEAKRMVLIREDSTNKDPGFFERLLGAKPAFDKQEQKTTLAHEMTHALQDQLYGLRELQKRIEKDDDMSLAFSALVEGDATLLMLAEMDGGSDITEMDPEVLRATFSIMSFMLPVAGGATYRKAPAIFRESLIFPYFQGMIFALSLAGDKGWQNVHAAYDALPTSTEQVLHPEKYTANERDEPQRVVLPDLKPALSDGWKHLGGNCLGEFQTSILLKRLRSGRRASAGWDGDRYEVFEHSDGRLGLVFVSIWDSPRDAQEFAASYRELRQPTTVPSGPDDSARDDNGNEDNNGTDNKAEPTRPNDRRQKKPSPAPAESTVVLGAQLVVDVEGDQVAIVEGFPSDVTEKIKELLTQVKFEPKPFPSE